MSPVNATYRSMLTTLAAGNPLGSNDTVEADRIAGSVRAGHWRGQADEGGRSRPRRQGHTPEHDRHNERKRAAYHSVTFRLRLSQRGRELSSYRKTSITVSDDL